LPENFRRPYLSTTPSIFWTRWHMTLSFWIRDYLFLPVATMRREVWWRNAMLVFSMVVFGIWHKLSILFLAWGVYHGLLLFAHRMIQQHQRRTGATTPRPWHPLASWFVTFVAITFSWFLFRANDAVQAARLARAAIIPSFAPSVLPVSFYLLVAVIVVGYFVVEGLMSLRKRDELAVSLFPLELRYVCYAGIFYFTVFHTAVAQSFIY